MRLKLRRRCRLSAGSRTNLPPAQVGQNQPVLPLDAVRQLLGVAVVLVGAQVGQELGQLVLVQLEHTGGDMRRCLDPVLHSVDKRIGP